MTETANLALFVGGVLVLALAVAVLALGAWWWSRAVTAVASARVNLVEARERESPPIDVDDDAVPALMRKAAIPTDNDLVRAAAFARMERGDWTTESGEGDVGPPIPRGGHFNADALAEEQPF